MYSRFSLLVIFVVLLLVSSTAFAQPFNFDYRFVDSHDSTGPTFQWETITGSTATLSYGSTDDGYYGPLNIGFPFLFCDTLYMQFYLSTNGYISFGGGTTQIRSNFPSIYCWARDGATTRATAIKYQTLTNPNRCVIEIDRWSPFYGSSSTFIDWQAVLYADGRILLLYRNYLGTVTSYGGYIGIQSANNQYNLIYCDGSMFIPTANTAVLYYPFRLFNPTPPDSATNIATNASLQWSVTYSNPRTVYNVELDTVNPPLGLVSFHQTSLHFTPTLQTSKTYYWHIVTYLDSTNTTSRIIGPIWRFTTVTVQNASEAAALPDKFQLYPIYPNPFNSTATLRFSLPVTSQVRSEAFDMTGRKVMMLQNESLPAGVHTIHFDGSKLASGIYLVRIQAGKYSAHQKVVLLK